MSEIRYSQNVVEKLTASKGFDIPAIDNAPFEIANVDGRKNKDDKFVLIKAFPEGRIPVSFMIPAGNLIEQEIEGFMQSDGGDIVLNSDGLVLSTAGGQNAELEITPALVEELAE